ncbi:MAG: PAS domain S-box protein [Halolamina sp.]
MEEASNSIRILHVDNEPSFADMAATLLQRKEPRFDIETVQSAGDGLDRLAAADFDCVISDYDMPRRNGIEFLDAVREEYSRLPFILFTGKGSEEVASEAISAGATDYLQKQPGGEQYELLANRIKNAVRQAQSQRAERHLRELAESTDHLLCVFTHDWSETLFVNSAYESAWGRSTEALREDPLNILDWISPDDRDRVRQAMDRTSDGETVELQCRIDSDEDHDRWARVRAEPIHDDAGEVVRVAGFVTEITEQKRSQQRIEQYQRLVDSLSEPVAVYDPEGRYRLVNRALCDLRGATPDELVGEHSPHVRRIEEQKDGAPFEDLLGGEREAIEGEYEAAFDGDSPRVFEYRFTALTLDDETKRILGISRDVTDRRRRERELEQKRDLLRHTERVANVGGVEVEPHTETVRWTNGARAVHDVSEEYEPNVETALDFYVPEDRETVRRQFERCLETGEPYQGEYRIRTADGAVRWVEIRGELVEKGGGTTLVRGAIQDVTDRKRREQELKRQNDRLEEFVGVVSHDLRNPLAVAEGQLNLAREECSSDHLEPAADAINRSLALIEDLLTLAREGEQVGEVEAVELAATADSCWHTVETDDATLEVEASRSVRADPSRLRQLLENLFRNAVEHGGGDVTVTVGNSPTGFHVADDGPGIPADRRDQVLEPGFSTSENGTGFGLNIVREIAEAHGWSVRVTEADGGGTRIELTDVDVDAADYGDEADPSDEA